MTTWLTFIVYIVMSLVALGALMFVMNALTDLLVWGIETLCNLWDRR